MNKPFEEYESCAASIFLNKMNIPVTLLKPNKENAEEFNFILQWLKDKEYNDLEMSKAGGISSRGLMNLPAYNYTISKVGAELIIIDNRAYRIQFRTEPDKGDEGRIYSGRHAWFNWLNFCEKYGINMEKYAILNGKYINDTIPKPLIRLGEYALTDSVYHNVHHIDFHSSYPAGLAITHPEFKEMINFLYESRKFKKLNKATLNYSIGMMHSRNIGWKYSQLAYDAISNNNERVMNLSKKVAASGCTILLYNTDGFWYEGNMYHDENEGDQLGMWHHDHLNCKIRIKSPGAYEYVENGKVYPVVRGTTQLDSYKDRENWEWGDIYSAPLIKFFCDKEGIHLVKEIEK